MNELILSIDSNKKRRHDRTPIILVLDVSNSGEPKKSGRAVITNVSKSGAGFSAGLEFKKDESIILKFIMPNNKEYQFNARVRRVQPKSGVLDYGVEFTGLSLFNRFKLSRLISIYKKSN